MTADAPGSPHQPGAPGTASRNFRCVTSACPTCGGSGVVTQPTGTAQTGRKEER